MDCALSKPGSALARSGEDANVLPASCWHPARRPARLWWAAMASRCNPQAHWTTGLAPWPPAPGRPQPPSALDHRALGPMIFAQPTERRLLQALTHLLVKDPSTRDPARHGIGGENFALDGQLHMGFQANDDHPSVGIPCTMVKPRPNPPCPHCTGTGPSRWWCWGAG